MKLETLKLEPQETIFLLHYLKTALFEKLEPMRKDAIVHLQARPVGRYSILGATITDHQYIVNAKDNGNKLRANAGEVPELYQNQEFFSFGEI